METNRKLKEEDQNESPSVTDEKNNKQAKYEINIEDISISQKEVNKEEQDSK